MVGAWDHLSNLSALVYGQQWRRRGRSKRHPEQARLFGLSQSERKIVPVDVDLAAVFFLTQRFDQTDQRLPSVQKFLRRTGGTQSFHRFLTRIDPEQKVVVGNRRSAKAAPDLFKGWVGRCPKFPLFRATPAQNLVLHVGIHEVGRFLAPESQRVLDDLIGDFLVTLADDDVDSGLKADKLGKRGHHDGITEFRAYASGFPIGNSSRFATASKC